VQDHDVEASLDVGETDEWRHHLSRPRHSNSGEERTEDIPTRRAGCVPGSFSSLNPRIRVGDIIAEPVVVNEPLPKAQMQERVQELLRLVGLNPGASNLFPHEFTAVSASALPSPLPCR